MVEPKIGVLYSHKNCRHAHHASTLTTLANTLWEGGHTDTEALCYFLPAFSHLYFLVPSDQITPVLKILF